AAPAALWSACRRTESRDRHRGKPQPTVGRPGAAAHARRRAILSAACGPSGSLPQRMRMVKRPVALANAWRAYDRAARILARAVDRVLDRKTLCEADRHSRSQGTAGAVGMPGIDPRALPQAL